MKMVEPRRPIRPVERQPMREWLIDHLDRREVPGCEWTDRTNGEFRIKWCHGSRHGWSIKDADLFERWAKHTGRFNEDKKDPKKWKANFRCALNSRKDIEEITKKDQSKGSSAYRVYRMKGAVVKDKKRPTTQPECHIARKTLKIEDEDRIQVQTCEETRLEEDQTPLYSRINSSMAERTFKTQLPNFEKILPDFEKLEYGKNHVLPRQGSGFRVEVLRQPIPLDPIPGVSRSLWIRREEEMRAATPHTNTYPLTPEDSEASHVTDDEDMEFLNGMSQEVCQEVTVESTDSENFSTYIITDISNQNHRPTTDYKTGCVNTKNIPITNQNSYPLTPPLE